MKKYLEFILGIILVSIGYSLFIIPSSVVTGGVSGIAILINKLCNFNIPLIVLIFDILLLILSYILLGREKTTKSVVGSILYPACLELVILVTSYFPSLQLEKIVAVVAGATLTGIGMGLVLKTGFTTGGADIIAQIISKYFKISLGKAVFITEGIIVTLSIFVLGLSSFVYSLIAVYIIGIAVDKVLLGISSSKTFFIITDRESEIKNFIKNDMNSKITIIKSKDNENDTRKIIVCISSTREYTEIKEGILAIDNEALVLITDAYEAFNI